VPAFPNSKHSYDTSILTVIRPVLEYAAPVWHNLITKTQADQIEAISQKESHPYHLYMHTRYADMPYVSATFVADLPSSHYVRPQGSTVQKIFQFHSTAYFPSTHTSSSPSRPTRQLPITRLRAASKFPRIPTRTKKYQSFLSYSLVCPSPLSDLLSSPNHYDCIVLIIVLYYCVLLLFYYCIHYLVFTSP